MPIALPARTGPFHVAGLRLITPQIDKLSNMRNYQCTCGNRLFFENTICLKCRVETGFCPACQSISPLVQQANGKTHCGHPDCNVVLRKCSNFSQYDVCNRCVVVTEVLADESMRPVESTVELLCDCCRFNRTIPDLSVVGNQQKWSRLEAAK